MVMVTREGMVMVTRKGMVMVTRKGMVMVTCYLRDGSVSYIPERGVLTSACSSVHRETLTDKSYVLLQKDYISYFCWIGPG